MYVEVMNNHSNANMELEKNTSDAKKVTYSIKKMLKKLFKKQQHLKTEKHTVMAQNLANNEKANSLESLESLENQRNAGIEMEAISLESYENDVNERLSLDHNSALSCEIEDCDFADLTTVPVHFVRTEHGTFFWTATSELAADNDLIEPLYCSTKNQLAISQMQDRWAQA